MLLRHHALLCQHKRFRYLLEQGVYLAERYTAAKDLLLFQLPQCYVEVAFARDVETIIWIKCFTNTDKLEPYLNSINIASAFGV